MPLRPRAGRPAKLAPGATRRIVTDVLIPFETLSYVRDAPDHSTTAAIAAWIP